MALYSTTVVWFRLDLRTDDHKPLVYAARRGRVVPVYILDTSRKAGQGHGLAKPQTMGMASHWWLHHSLDQLSNTLEQMGSPLLLRVGDPLCELKKLCDEVGADQVAIHELTYQIAHSIEDTIDRQLGESDIELVRFSSDTLWPVGSVLTESTTPYKVFTPFWNKASQLEVEGPVDPPIKLCPPLKAPSRISLGSLKLLDTVGWSAKFHARWTPGEANAQESLHQFISSSVHHQQGE